MRKAIFIDIDDVLLSARALVLPGNRRFLKERGLTVDPGQVSFDPIGIEMLNRIAELAEAQFVVSSSWRYTVGVGPTLDALVRNGLSVNKLHADPFCPMIGIEADGATGKARDIIAWLNQHAETEYWITLDNDAGLAPHLASQGANMQGRVIEVDPLIGISARDFGRALQCLGAQRDPDLRPFKAFQVQLDESAA